MSETETWKRYRAWLFDDPELGFRLDLSRMDLPDDYPERMADKTAVAIEAMRALEAGAKANPDENRQVGHYWLRDEELAPSEEIGRAIRETRQAVATFATAVRRGELRPARAERFEHLLLIGIGGSALGPQFVAQALCGTDDGLIPHFLDNSDPDGIDRLLAGLPAERTLVVVVSKSGGTPETRNTPACGSRASDGDRSPHHRP